jgi:hypothetical protein
MTGFTTSAFLSRNRVSLKEAFEGQPRLPFASELGIRFRVYLKYELGVVPKTFLNMEMKALGVL